MNGKVSGVGVMRARPARMVAVAVLALAAPAALPGGSAGALTVDRVTNGDAQVARKARPMQTTTSGVRFTSRVVDLSPSLVHRELIGVSANGTYAFRRAVGPIASLRKAKVMVIPGIAALDVTGIVRTRGRILVQTVPAKLPDLLSAGRITFSGAPNFDNGALSGVGLPAGPRSASDSMLPRSLHGARTVARSAQTTAAVSARGAVGKIGYALTFTPTSSQRLDIAGDLCFTASGGNCERGFPGLSYVAKLNGYLQVGNVAGSVSVSPFKGIGASLALNNISGRLELTYHITNHDGTESNPPVVQLPVTYGVTIPDGPVPLYLRLQLILALSFGLPKGSTENGGVIWTSSAGTEAVKLTGQNVTTSPSGSVGADVQILDQSNGGAPLSFSPTAGGSAITVREKVGFGLGFDAAYGIAFVDFIDGLGQEMGSAVVGQFCSSYFNQFSVGAGLEGQVGTGPLALRLSTRRQLYERKDYTNGPGCPPIGRASDAPRPS